MKQLIISLGRQVGSGGHKIAEALAERFSLPLYDKNLIAELAAQRELDPETLRKYEEAPRHPYLSRSIRGLSNSAEAGLAGMQFLFLREKAAKGDSFVVLGRCSGYILREFPGLISLFVRGDLADRVASIQQAHHLTQDEALEFIRKGDKRRAAYHNEHCPPSGDMGTPMTSPSTPPAWGSPAPRIFWRTTSAAGSRQNHDKTKNGQTVELTTVWPFSFLCQRCCK
ncbi:MAG: cytidylate kinase-like family protein [Evtepia gabavorous]